MASIEPATGAAVADAIEELERDIAATGNSGPPVDKLVGVALAMLTEAERYFAHYGAFAVQFRWQCGAAAALRPVVVGRLADGD
jgi:hypothetical protein